MDLAPHSRSRRHMVLHFFWRASREKTDTGRDHEATAGARSDQLTGHDRLTMTPRTPLVVRGAARPARRQMRVLPPQPHEGARSVGIIIGSEVFRIGLIASSRVSPSVGAAMLSSWSSRLCSWGDVAPQRRGSCGSDRAEPWQHRADAFRCRAILPVRAQRLRRDHTTEMPRSPRVA